VQGARVQAIKVHKSGDPLAAQYKVKLQAAAAAAGTASCGQGLMFAQHDAPSCLIYPVMRAAAVG
jgi:hypothetical protein